MFLEEYVSDQLLWIKERRKLIKILKLKEIDAVRLKITLKHAIFNLKMFKAAGGKPLRSLRNTYFFQQKVRS